MFVPIRKAASRGKDTGKDMEIKKKILAVLAALCLTLSLAPTAHAQGERATPTPAPGEQTQAAGEDAAIDEIMQELLARYGAAEENVYAGYLNLVTGEEHYWQGDEFVIAASMYKVPLNMMVAEKISRGELVWDEKYVNVPYDEVLEQTLLYSDNEWAMFLWSEFGSYADYRRAIAPYMGIDPETVEPAYFDNNEFTPRQMIHCLKLLYEEPDRFPRILETMKRAEPERFFRMNEKRFEIAHKYGYVTDWSWVYMNDCGIVFTDEPIAIVMFTVNVDEQEALLSDFCTAMCDYTQERAAERQREEQAAKTEQAAREAVRGTIREKTEQSLALLAPPTPRERAAGTEEINTGVTKIATILTCAAVVIAAIAAAILVIAKSRKNRIRPFWMIMAIFICAAAMLLCAVGLNTGTVHAKPDGDPAEVAEQFLNALAEGDYETAYANLRDYTSLGLETPPETEAGAELYKALVASYDYEMQGECRVDKLDAVQKVRFTYLDLTGIGDELESKTMEELEAIVKERSRAEIYDENDQYRPEIANEAYLRAVKDVMGNAQQYYTATEIELALTYSDGRWQVIMNPGLLKALGGGT